MTTTVLTVLIIVLFLLIVSILLALYLILGVLKIVDDRLNKLEQPFNYK